MKIIQGLLLSIALIAFGACGDDDGAAGGTGGGGGCGKTVQQCYAEGICKQELDASEACFDACHGAHESEAEAEACIEQTCVAEEAAAASCLLLMCRSTC